MPKKCSAFRCNKDAREGYLTCRKHGLGQGVRPLRTPITAVDQIIYDEELKCSAIKRAQAQEGGGKRRRASR